jgi:hypothetical protein
MLSIVPRCRCPARPVLCRRDHPPAPPEDRLVLAEAEPRPAGAAGLDAPAQGRDPRRAGRRVRRRHRHGLAIRHRDRPAAGRPRPRLGPALRAAWKAGHAFVWGIIRQLASEILPSFNVFVSDARISVNLDLDISCYKRFSNSAVPCTWASSTAQVLVTPTVKVPPSLSGGWVLMTSSIPGAVRRMAPPRQFFSHGALAEKNIYE